MLNLDEIKRRRAEIGEANWRDTVTEDGGLVVYLREPASPELAYAPPASFLFFGDMEDTDAIDHAQAEFIAQAPKDVASLVAEVEALRQALTASADMLHECAKQARAANWSDGHAAMAELIRDQARRLLQDGAA
jgi:hypothetical protein